jgi:hypothetical protein
VSGSGAYPHAAIHHGALHPRATAVCDKRQHNFFATLVLVLQSTLSPRSASSAASLSAGYHTATRGQAHLARTVLLDLLSDNHAWLENRGLFRVCTDLPLVDTHAGQLCSCTP